MTEREKMEHAEADGCETKSNVEQDDSWIPDEFRQAMVDANAGRFVEMDTVLRETPHTR